MESQRRRNLNGNIRGATRSPAPQPARRSPRIKDHVPKVELKKTASKPSKVSIVYAVSKSTTRESFQKLVMAKMESVRLACWQHLILLNLPVRVFDVSFEHSTVCATTANEIHQCGRENPSPVLQDHVHSTVADRYKRHPSSFSIPIKDRWFSQQGQFQQYGSAKISNQGLSKNVDFILLYYALLNTNL